MNKNKYNNLIKLNFWATLFILFVVGLYFKRLDTTVGFLLFILLYRLIIKILMKSNSVQNFLSSRLRKYKKTEKIVLILTLVLTILRFIIDFLEMRNSASFDILDFIIDWLIMNLFLSIHIYLTLKKFRKENIDESQTSLDELLDDA